MTVAPSGRQFSITAGPHQVTLVEVGGGIRTYTYRERPVLDGCPVNEMCTGASPDSSPGSPHLDSPG